jgi:predicted transcriptional regulator
MNALSQQQNHTNFWGTPKSKSVGLFTDFTLYYDALKLCKSLGIINVSILRKELSQRIIGIRYVAELQKRAFLDLVRELNEFKFIRQKDRSASHVQKIYEITNEGLDLINIYEINRKKFSRILTSKMFEVYTIPGWFVNRLWKINPDGQGQVIIPAPLKSWNPSSYALQNYSWNIELDKQLHSTFEKVTALGPNFFPVDLNKWSALVKQEYERLGKLKKRQEKEDVVGTKKTLHSFAPRRRLATAMRTSALQILFSNEYSDTPDFSFEAPIMSERNYMAWCPRLEALELIYYSDHFREIPGRLLFPLTVFKSNAGSADFEINDKVFSPSLHKLHYFQPNWLEFKLKFLTCLTRVYQNLHNKQRILYVSLQDVRDEVCRLLRISSILFEKFLEEAFRASLMREINFTIALETDIREDQMSGSQILRKPVYVQAIPHSLIAININ